MINNSTVIGIIRIVLILILLLNFKFIKCDDTTNTINTTIGNNNNNNSGSNNTITNEPLCPEKPWCPCICQECGPPIGRKNSKQTFVYISGGKQSNYTYFEKDPSVKWEEIDTMALYSNKFDKRITCLAHSKNVKIVFIVEESNIFDNFKYLKVNGNYWDGYINTTRLGNTLLENNVDGYNLDFEYGSRYGKDQEFSNTLKTLYTKLKSMGQGYQLSSAFGSYYGESLKNQIKTVANYLDFIVIMGYDLINTNAGTNITNSANSPIDLRTIVKKWWLDPLNPSDSNKIILAIPWYGYYVKCELTDQQKSNPATIFQSDCIVDNSKVLQKPVKELIRLLNNDYILLGNTSNTIKYSSGILWSSNTQTVFSRYRDEKGDIYQANFDTPYSIYLKIRSLGIGGVGVWSLEKIVDLPQPIIDSYYFAFSKNNIGDKYIEYK
ncbi:hypothetical protein RB653_008093 [Dictyostelium firmibasis]|uniref:Chitinase II/V-like catalytic domain-containing protein n=1 Tax=Dictyostelium firmibasis TaxID=79012 RepID=A0AAN7YWC8_9MYCE